MDEESTGIEVDHDQFMAFAEARNREDKERASSAGESRQKIGEFLKETNLNSQAVSWSRSILKKPKETQKLDIIQSMEILLPMVKDHVLGQQPDMFSSAATPATQEDFEPVPEHEMGGEPALDVDDFDRQLLQAAGVE